MGSVAEQYKDIRDKEKGQNQASNKVWMKENRDIMKEHNDKEK